MVHLARLGLSGEGIDEELVIQQGQDSQLEELDTDRAQQVQEWLEGQ